MAPTHGTRPLIGGTTTVQVDGLERARVPWVVGQEIASLVEQVMAQGVDVRTLQVDARTKAARGGGTPALTIRVSAQPIPAPST